MHDRRRALFQADDAAVHNLRAEFIDPPVGLVNAPVSLVNAMVKCVDVLVVEPGGHKKIESTIAIVLPKYGIQTWKPIGTPTS